MTPLKLRLYPDPVLHRRASPVTTVTEEVRTRARAMVELMFARRGIGLAGNQVGWLARVVVVCPTGNRGEEEVLINPEILAAEGEVVAEEGCLSFPQIYGPVVRAERICYRYRTLADQVREATATGLAARVIQHEVDHLDGILFIQRMRPADRQALRGALKELERRYRERKVRGPAA